MELNYKDLGARIKTHRSKQNFSQARLAEIAELESSSHISHIETGNTKVGLPTLIKIANALSVSLDELVCDSLKKAKHVFQNEIMQETEDCNEKEIRIIADIVKSLKVTLRKRS